MLQCHWEDVDSEYFVRHDIDSLAWIGTRLAHARVVDLPLVSARYHEGTEVTQFLVAAPDSETLLLRVAGGFDQLGLSIADAKIHRLKSGLVLQVFVIFDRKGEVISRRSDLEHLATGVREHIRRPDVHRGDATVLNRAMRHFPIRTQVRFIDAPVGAEYSIMEVTAQDRPGLVYQVARVLLDCKLHLESAKIATFGEKVEDIFFISDRDRKPIRDDAMRDRIKQEIVQALDSEDRAKRSNAA